MKKIYARAIQMANPVTLQEKLAAIVTKIDRSEYAERLMDILFDADIKEDEIPYIVENYNEIRTRKSFDYLNHRIDYDYQRIDTRYFVNEADAIEYAKSGNYDYNTSKNTARDGYPYEGKHIVCSESYCNLYEWMNSRVIEK